jgi:hypothetical protein
MQNGNSSKNGEISRVRKPIFDSAKIKIFPFLPKHFFTQPSKFEEQFTLEYDA